MPERPAQQPAVAALQDADKKPLVLVEPLQPGQHVVRHDRRERDGDNQARENRDDVGLSKWREEPPFDAREREERHEDQNDDHRGVNDAGADLLARRYDHVEDRPRVALLLFSRKRRKMFSTSTTASSTSSPMAMASPPSVIVLMDSPIQGR